VIYYLLFLTDINTIYVSNLNYWPSEPKFRLIKYGESSIVTQFDYKK